MTVAWADRAEVIHADGPPGWAYAEPLRHEVDEEDDDDDADLDFLDRYPDEPDRGDEQRVLLASFETHRLDRAGRRLMNEARAAQENLVTGFRVHRLEQQRRQLAALEEDRAVCARADAEREHGSSASLPSIVLAEGAAVAAAARAARDAAADATAVAARARATQAVAEAEAAAERSRWMNALEEGQARRRLEEGQARAEATHRARTAFQGLTPTQRRHLIDRSQRALWGDGGAGPSGAGGSGGQ